jgi:Zn-finger nucleic acid-binding protein
VAWKREKYDIICPHCGGSYHETTDEFSSEEVAKGSMFRLKSPYRDEHSWQSFPEDPDVRFADLECPWCGGCYVDATGKVIKLIRQSQGKAKKEGTSGGKNAQEKKVQKGKQAQGKAQNAKERAAEG